MAAPDAAGAKSLVDAANERLGEAFVQQALRIWKEQALPEADRGKLEHFLRRAEESPQAADCSKHAEDQEDHLVEFVWKLALYAPEEWYEVVSDSPRPETLKNDFSVIGVAFDASSRLRRAGVEYYHWKQTARMAGLTQQISGYPATPCVFYLGAGAKEVRPAGSLPQPPAGTVRVVAVSDTHLFHRPLDAALRMVRGDFLVHAGDLCYEESRSPDAEMFNRYRDEGKPLAGPDFHAWFEASGVELEGALRWLGGQQGFEHKVLTGGNHDYILEQLGNENADRLCQKYGVTYLYTERPPVTLQLRSRQAALRFWGSGLSFAKGLSTDRAVISGNNSFQFSEEDGEKLLLELRGGGGGVGLSPGAADVMVTHSPPKGCLLNPKGGQGAEAINELVKHVQPALYVCGHAHRPNDPMKDVWADIQGVLGVNAACLGTWNHLWGLPVVADVAPRAQPQAAGVTPEEHALVKSTKMLVLRGIPDSAKPWDICLHFAPFMVATLLPLAAQAGKQEAIVFFELFDHARAALEKKRGQPFGTSSISVQLEPYRLEDKVRNSQEWVCLFDIIGSGPPPADIQKREYLTEQDLQRARAAGLLPKVPLCQTSK
mmetsp:Transcript_116202/g.323616  ORF Transcript_116202/g.323616 Transcript_116202/m.323616 type:complete len:602 (-) Transcript_116202:142-1947(-)